MHSFQSLFKIRWSFPSSEGFKELGEGGKKGKKGFVGFCTAPEAKDGAAPSAPQCSGSRDRVNQGGDAAIPPFLRQHRRSLPPGTWRNPLQQREKFLPGFPVLPKRGGGSAGRLCRGKAGRRRGPGAAAWIERSSGRDELGEELGWLRGAGWALPVIQRAAAAGQGAARGAGLILGIPDGIPEPWNHREGWVGRDLREHRVPSPAMGSDSFHWGWGLGWRQGHRMHFP